MPTLDENQPWRRLVCRCLARLPEKMHLAFIGLALPLVFFLSFLTPPFQSPDETEHFERCYQVAHGQFFGAGGGYVDEAIESLYGVVSHMQFHREARFTATDQNTASALQWAGHQVFTPLAHVGGYSPVGYLPQALAIWIGEASRLSVWHTLILARTLNGIVGVFLCGLALLWCRRGRAVMFTVLMFPMTLSLFASASQDAALIVCTCLVCAMVSRALAAHKPLSRGGTVALVLLLLVISLGRPPYAVLAAIVFIPGLLIPWRRMTTRVLSALLFGCVWTATLAWWLAARQAMKEFARPDLSVGTVDARLQMMNLLHHPIVLVYLLLSSIYQIFDNVASMIGNLGWLDTPMPTLYYLAMSAVLLLAVLSEAVTGREFDKPVRALLLGSAFISLALLFCVEYLVWTPVGKLAVYGMQGRYMIPLAIAAGMGIPALRVSPAIYQRATTAIVLAQLITYIVLPQVIFARYYLSQ